MRACSLFNILKTAQDAKKIKIIGIFNSNLTLPVYLMKYLNCDKNFLL